MDSKLTKDECTMLCTHGFYKSLFSKPLPRSFILTNQKLIIYSDSLDENSIPSTICLMSICEINNTSTYFPTKHLIEIKYEIEETINEFKLDFANDKSLRDEFFLKLENSMTHIKKEQNNLVIQEANKTQKPNDYVYFDNVFYYIAHEKREYPAKFEISGRNYRSFIYRDESLYLERGIEYAPSQEVKYEVIRCENDYVYVNIYYDKSYIRMSFSDYELFKGHNDYINAKFINLRKEFQRSVINKLPFLLSNSELIQMAENLLIDHPSIIYLDYRNLIGLECYIENKTDYGNFLFLSTKIQRQNSIFDEVTIRQGTTITRTHIKNEEILWPFMKEAFIPFVKIVDRQFSINDELQTYYLVHLLLLNIVIDNYAHSFSLNYSNYFTDIENLSKEEALRRYCDIDTIDPTKIETFGSFVYYLIHHNIFEDRNYINNFQNLYQRLQPILEERKLINFANRLKRPKTLSISTADPDFMTGQEFEQFLADLFIKMGYEVAITKASGDQGVDIIATKDGKKLGIQAKRYSGSVGNGAVQEAVAGKNFYHLDKVMVITNSIFTASAMELANANQVILWDRNLLKEKIANLL